MCFYKTEGCELLLEKGEFSRIYLLTTPKENFY